MTTTGKIKAQSPTMLPKIVKKSISQVQRDIADWKNANRLAGLAQTPKFYLLQDLYNEITNDALLSSQISNRIEDTVSSPFELYDANTGKVDDKNSIILNDFDFVRGIIQYIIESKFYGYSIVELSREFERVNANMVPRQNIDPVNGLFYPDYHSPNAIPYRTASEYGKWILEFNSGNPGLLNKSCPHVLFKKFAQSCWSELCEIFGIPPRYIKTNTQDDGMLNRAEDMLKEMGAAAAFVIDTTEEFQFAQGTQTNGDVYNNLIQLCNNEISMLISGAIIGQDTKHGNRSKEEVSREVLDKITESDRRMVETYMNNTVIPALISTGIIPQTQARFRFSAVENTDKMWTLIKEILPYKDVDNDWISEKFGIPVKDKFGSEEEFKEINNKLNLLNHITGGDPDFFV